ncbi:MAG TPA: bacteriohopanetetrol glucosamine biosynthesis glycosyltransferase HpnI [Lichenihabitans sp.]|nr:bacteriohopanetetrol glucosamine biosynthesis glycosyltransferase HpnI [Lichenihabitans sp.]
MITVAFLILALAGCLYTLLAATVVLRGMRRRGVAPADMTWPSVTILKPLHGEEPHLERNLETFLRQDYPAPVEIVFGVGNAADPAIATVDRLRLANPERAIRLVVDARRWGENGKVSNLVNMAEHARHEVIVLADSDMSVGPDYLRRVAAALAAPGVGAVTCLYRGLALPNLWSRLATQWIDHHFLPNVLVGMALGLAKPCFGSTIALRAETLERIGGFRAFADRLADDYAIGEAVRKLGLDVAVPGGLVLGHLCAATTPRQVLRQEVRWARTIRSVDPSGFFGSVVTNPVPLATIGALLADFSTSATAILGAAVASRLLLQLLIAGFVKARPVGLILGPLRDYAAFLVFILSFWPGSIDWRGHRFALQSDGTLASSDIAGS